MRGNKKAEEKTPYRDFRASSSEFLLNTGDEPQQRKVSGTRDVPETILQLPGYPKVR